MITLITDRRARQKRTGYTKRHLVAAFVIGALVMLLGLAAWAQVSPSVPHQHLQVVE